MTKHKLYDFLRSKQGKTLSAQISIEEIQWQWETTFLEEGSQEDSDFWEQCKQYLSQKEMTLLEMAKIEERPLAEIAKELSMSVSNVKVQIFRAIKKLKKHF